MRWFVVLLLVSNVILFFWVEQESLKSTREASIPPPEIGRLRLLKDGQEVKEESPAAPAIAELQSAAQEMADETPQRVEQSSPVEPSPAELSQASSKGSISETPSRAEGPTSAAVQTDADKPAFSVLSDAFARLTDTFTETGDEVAADAAEASLPADIEPEAAVLATAQPEAEADHGTNTASAVMAEPGMGVAPELSRASEPETDQGPERVAKAREPATTEIVADEAAMVAESCGRVGPLKPAEADALLKGLPANIELLSDTSSEQQVVTAYYVLIPPLASRAEGQKKVRELNAAGLKDTWLFQGGEYRNGISLGVFSQKRGAQRHAALAVQKGFAAVVRDKTSPAERRWLALRLRGDGELSATLPLPKGVGLTSQRCP